MTDEQGAQLSKRVAAMEEAFRDIAVVLKRYSVAVAQPSLLSVVEAIEPATERLGLMALSDELVARFYQATGRKYAFDGAKDAAAVKRLSKLGLEKADLLSRWEQSARLKTFPGTQSLAVFASRINEFGTKSIPAAVSLTGDLY